MLYGVCLVLCCVDLCLTGDPLLASCLVLCAHVVFHVIYLRDACSVGKSCNLVSCFVIWCLSCVCVVLCSVCVVLCFVLSGSIS